MCRHKIGSGRLLLNRFADVKEKLNSTLKAFREVWVIINASIVLTVLLAYLKQLHPEQPIREEVSQENLDTPLFEILMVRFYLYRELRWTIRCGTRAGQNIPNDWQLQGKKHTIAW